MGTAEPLEVLAHGLTAVLGLWLGITVGTRSRTPHGRVFAFLSLSLAVWSSSILLNRLSSSVEAGAVARIVEEVATALAIGAVAHVALVIATEGLPTRRQRTLVASAYLLNALFALPVILDPEVSAVLSSPHVAGDALSAALGWGRLAVRLATLAAAAWWLVRALGDVGDDAVRGHQVRVALGTVLVGAAGGSIRNLPVVSESPPWIGVSLVALAMVLAASAVLSAGVFFAPQVAGRAFRTSLGVGLGLFLLVAVMSLVDTASRDLLGLEVPLFGALVLIIAIAAYDPVAARVRAMPGGVSSYGAARARMLRALGQPALTAQPAEAGIEPALQRVVRALELTGAAVVRPDGTVVAGHGDVAGLPTTRPLVADGERVGELRLGGTRSGRPLAARDEALLELAAAYLAGALRTGAREVAQVEALSGLSREREDVDATASNLHAALVRRSTPLAALRVFALGPLRAELGGEPIRRWGGQKAGSRQAEALFAFLFDRGERGVAKDEALELIWPDTDFEHADLAFHRTLLGLRHALDPVHGDGKHAIRFQSDRYRLDPSLVEWSDVAEFGELLDRARSAADAAERVGLLEAARRQYRGEYLDDCPFYGDSVHVEDRRALLRGRLVDLLIALGEAYEQRTDRVSAAAAYREALQAAAMDCPPAAAGLARLGVAS